MPTEYSKTSAGPRLHQLPYSTHNCPTSSPAIGRDVLTRNNTISGLNSPTAGKAPSNTCLTTQVLYQLNEWGNSTTSPPTVNSVIWLEKAYGISQEVQCLRQDSTRPQAEARGPSCSKNRTPVVAEEFTNSLKYIVRTSQLAFPHR